MPKFLMSDEELVAVTLATSLGVQMMSAILKHNVEVEDSGDEVTITFLDDDREFFLNTSRLLGTMLIGLENPNVNLEEITIEMAAECVVRTQQIAAKTGSQLNEACTALLDSRIAAYSKSNQGAPDEANTDS